MDTWQNGDPEVGPAIGMNRPAAQQGTVATINGNILADGTAGNPSMIEGTICITVLPNGLVSYTSTGAITNADFENVATGFVLDDAHTFAFTARTGGANQEVFIDNIELTTGLPDSDGDGLYDLFEQENGLDPLSADGDDGAAGDPDGDGLSNLDEQNAGTDPQSGDTDGDGLSDAVEDGGGVYVSASQTGTSPTNPDTDGDNLLDGVEDPNEFFVDENQPGTDPNNPNTDGDSATDGVEIIVGRNPQVADDPGPSSTYAQDFDAFPDGFMDLADNSVIGSTNNESAQVVGQRLRLTEEGVGSTFASFRTPPLIGSSAGFTATFDFEITDLPGANNPADGFSFNYGAIPATGHGSAEEGWAGVEHISFEIDTWNNGAGEAGVGIASVAGGIPTDHVVLNGLPLADGGSVSGTATISWNPDSGASFSTTGLGPLDVNFENVEIPGFTGDDNFIFAFSARTGGATEDLFIDNLVITTGAKKLFLDVESAPGDMLRFTFESKAGKIYDIVTSLDGTGDPTNPDDWPVWQTIGVDDVTPPENVEEYPRPGDPKRFFVVVEKEAPALFFDDFETDLGWIAGSNPGDSGTTEWQRGEPMFEGPAVAFSGVNCWGTNIADLYTDQADIVLRSPDIDLTAAGITSAELTYREYVDTDLLGGDGGIIRVLLASDPTQQLGADVTPALIEDFLFDWRLATYPLPPEAIGQVIKLEFRFVSDDNLQSFSGWYIDDVEVAVE